MNASAAEERARLRNALQTCRREAEWAEEWLGRILLWDPRSETAATCREAAAKCAIHAEATARAYFRGIK